MGKRLCSHALPRTPAGIRFLLVLALVASTVGFPAKHADAAAPGQIAFTWDGGVSGSPWNIYVMNADGTGTRNLSGGAGYDGDAAWSRDGSRLAFSSTRDGSYQIYVMNADGSGQQKLTGAGNNRFPSWSPDGSRIAFASNRDGNWQIYVMSSSGANQTRLTVNNSREESPSWSPDGSKLVFDSNRARYFDVYVMNADGSGQTRLTVSSSEDNTKPSFSPDGTKVLFATGPSFPQIAVVNADGTGRTTLATSFASDDPSWSPDGAWVVFSGNVAHREIYIMRSDGSGLTQLTLSPDDKRFPSWTGPLLAQMPPPPSPLTTFTLTVNKGGNGSGTVTIPPADTCGGSCSAKTATYAPGTTVTLTAAPDPGSSFVGWSGACSGTLSCSLVMNAKYSVTATFNAAPPQTLATPAISVSARCDGTFPAFDLVVNPVSGASTYELYKDNVVVGNVSVGSNEILGNVAGRTYTFKVRAVGGSLLSGFSTSVTMTAPNCQPQQSTTNSFSGRVYNANTNAGLSTVLVRWGDSGTYTNDSGSYTFSNVSCGVQELSVNLSGYQPFSRSYPLTCGTPVAPVDIPLQPLSVSVLSGQVRNLGVSPGAITAGQAVVASATVTNTGTISGTFRLSFAAPNVCVGGGSGWSTTLAPGEVASASFGCAVPSNVSGPQSVPVILDMAQPGQPFKNAQQVGTVSFNVGPIQAPQLAVTPTSLDFGSADTMRSLSLTNSGTAPLTWNAGAGVLWISLTPSSGSVPAGASVSINVQVGRVGWAPDSYSGTIFVSSNGGAQSVAVTMVVPTQRFGASYSAPALVFVGADQERFLSVHLTNTGDASWNASGYGPTKLSYHVYTTGGQLLDWNGVRTGLGGDVRAGEARDVQMRIVAPIAAGTYLIGVDLVRESVAWFTGLGVAPFEMLLVALSGFSASYGPDDLPTQVRVGSQIPVTLHVSNTGSNPWRANGTNAILPSYHVYGDQGALLPNGWDGRRGSFGADVQPGAVADARLTVAVPSEPGTYVIAWDLVQEGAFWFSNLGVPTVSHRIQVVSDVPSLPSAPVPPGVSVGSDVVSTFAVPGESHLYSLFAFPGQKVTVTARPIAGSSAQPRVSVLGFKGEEIVGEVGSDQTGASTASFSAPGPFQTVVVRAVGQSIGDFELSIGGAPVQVLPASGQPYAAPTQPWVVELPYEAPCMAIEFAFVDLNPYDSLVLYDQSGKEIERIASPVGRLVHTWSHPASGSRMSLTLEVNSQAPLRSQYAGFSVEKAVGVYDQTGCGATGGDGESVLADLALGNVFVLTDEKATAAEKALALASLTVDVACVGALVAGTEGAVLAIAGRVCALPGEAIGWAGRRLLKAGRYLISSDRLSAVVSKIPIVGSKAARLLLTITLRLRLATEVKAVPTLKDALRVLADLEGADEMVAKAKLRDALPGFKNWEKNTYQRALDHGVLEDIEGAEWEMKVAAAIKKMGGTIRRVGGPDVEFERNGVVGVVEAKRANFAADEIRDFAKKMQEDNAYKDAERYFIVKEKPTEAAAAALEEAKKAAEENGVHLLVGVGS